MASKYELPFSTNYVADWTYVEAFRELFQNALDNETQNPENKMTFEYTEDNMTMRIANKSSILSLESLLMGHTTKADDKDTIGRHGEGYKIAFLVLLRDGKGIKVYNYGRREVWDTKLVKSRRYNNQIVPVITVDKEAIWKKPPNDDLTIEVSGVTKAEYDNVVAKNLHLQQEVQKHSVPGKGDILTEEKEKGRLYVKGLYVCTESNLHYGYNFEPHLITLDRDRKLMKTVDILWETSMMWKMMYGLGVMRQKLLEMIEEGVPDITYIESNVYYAFGVTNNDTEIANDVAHSFVKKHGDATPVRDNQELQAVQQTGGRAVMVNHAMAKLLEKSDVGVSKVPEMEAISVGLRNLISELTDKLSDDQLERFEELVTRVERLEA